MTEEIWKPVVGFEGLYEVSNVGRVRSLPHPSRPKVKCVRVLKSKANQYGYTVVSLWKNGRGKTQGVHRIIAEAFLPNIDGLRVVNHINRIRCDNRLENLEWCSYAHNSAHLAGPQRTPKITREAARQVFVWYHQDHRRINDICDEVGLCRRSVGKIIARKTWIEATHDLVDLMDAHIEVPPPSVGEELWKDIPDWVGRYKVSNHGRVQSSCRDELRLLRPLMTRKGYGIVRLAFGNGRWKARTIHRLVAEAFLANPYDLEAVHHVDGNKMNNRADNLQWCDGSYNVRQSFKSGNRNHLRGECSQQAKLTEEQVREIRARFNGNDNNRASLSREYGITKGHVRDILTGGSWAHVA